MKSADELAEVVSNFLNPKAVKPHHKRIDIETRGGRGIRREAQAFIRKLLDMEYRDNFIQWNKYLVEMIYEAKDGGVTVVLYVRRHSPRPRRGGGNYAPGRKKGRTAMVKFTGKVA